MDKTKIREHMEVVGSDGEHVGTVDHLDGDLRLRLTKSDPAANNTHHWVSLQDIDHIDDKVYLRTKASEAKLINADVL